MSTITEAPRHPVIVATERTLATVATIESLHPIEGADAIVRARVRGWDVVVRLGEFAAGDRVIYFEVDSHLDTSQERFAFLATRGQSTSETGCTGHVLKTVRLRGQYSQGLVLPASDFPETDGFEVGDDVTSALDVVKWDPKLPDELEGTARGFLPTWFAPSAEVRVQNDGSIFADTSITDWIATEKIDGESMSIWAVGGEDHGVSGRNIDLLDDPSNKKWNLARSTGLLKELIAYATARGVCAVVQGEHYGAGAARNGLQLKDARIAVFAFYVDGIEIPRAQWPSWLLYRAAPVHDLVFPASSDEALAQVDGMKSLVNPERPAEGVVWRSLTSTTVRLPDGRTARASAKVISNRYAMKSGG